MGEDSTDYTALDGAYATIAEETALPPGFSATGQPTAPELPTTNAYPDGGLPMHSKEPYPVGAPPAARTTAQINRGL